MTDQTRPDQTRPDQTRPDAQITVAGVSFSADEVVSAIIKKDGREIVIQAVPEDEKKVGF